MDDYTAHILSRLHDCAEWMQAHGIPRVWVYLSGDTVDWTTVPDDVPGGIAHAIAYEGWGA